MASDMHYAEETARALIGGFLAVMEMLLDEGATDDLPPGDFAPLPACEIDLGEIVVLCIETVDKATYSMGISRHSETKLLRLQDEFHDFLQRYE